MRNPAKRRNISLIVVAIGLTLLTVMLLIHKNDTEVGGWFAIVIASFFASVFALVAVIVYQVHVRWIAHLKRGDERLAQWILSPAEWEQFRANDKTWRDSGRPNSFKPRKNATTSTEVVIAKNALMVDDDFYSLGAFHGLQWIPETPACLEYNMVTRTKNGSIRWNIRLPIATGAEPQARAVWDYAHRTVPFDAVRSARRFRIARAAGFVIGGVSAGALMYARITFGNPLTQTSTLASLILGLIGLPVGLCTAAICHWQLRKLERASISAAK